MNPVSDTAAVTVTPAEHLSQRGAVSLLPGLRPRGDSRRLEPRPSGARRSERARRPGERHWLLGPFGPVLLHQRFPWPARPQPDLRHGHQVGPSGARSDRPDGRWQRRYRRRASAQRGTAQYWAHPPGVQQSQLRHDGRPAFGDDTGRRPDLDHSRPAPSSTPSISAPRWRSTAPPGCGVARASTLTSPSASPTPSPRRALQCSTSGNPARPTSCRATSSVARRSSS